MNRLLLNITIIFMSVFGLSSWIHYENDETTRSVEATYSFLSGDLHLSLSGGQVAIFPAKTRHSDFGFTYINAGKPEALVGLILSDLIRKCSESSVSFCAYPPKADTGESVIFITHTAFIDRDKIIFVKELWLIIDSRSSTVKRIKNLVIGGETVLLPKESGLLRAVIEYEFSRELSPTETVNKKRLIDSILSGSTAL